MPIGSGKPSIYVQKMRDEGKMKTVEIENKKGKKKTHEYFEHDMIYYLIRTHAKNITFKAYDNVDTMIDDIRKQTYHHKLGELPTSEKARFKFDGFHKLMMQLVEKDEELVEEGKKKGEEYKLDVQEKKDKGKEKKKEEEGIQEEEEEEIQEEEEEEKKEEEEEEEKKEEEEEEKEEEEIPPELPYESADKKVQLTMGNIKALNDILKDINGRIVLNERKQEAHANKMVSMHQGIKELVKYFGDNQVMQVDLQDSNPLALTVSELSLLKNGKTVKTPIAEIVDQYGEIEKMSREIDEMDDGAEKDAAVGRMNEKIKEVVRKAKDLSVNKKHVKVSSKSDVAKRIHSLKV